MIAALWFVLGAVVGALLAFGVIACLVIAEEDAIARDRAVLDQVPHA